MAYPSIMDKAASAYRTRSFKSYRNPCVSRISLFDMASAMFDKYLNRGRTEIGAQSQHLSGQSEMHGTNTNQRHVINPTVPDEWATSGSERRNLLGMRASRVQPANNQGRQHKPVFMNEASCFEPILVMKRDHFVGTEDASIESSLS